MRVLIINSVCGIKSTGHIVKDIADEFANRGDEVRIAYGREYIPQNFPYQTYKICNSLNVKLNALSTRIFDNDGFTAKSCTLNFIKWADQFNPDIVWLHNLHGYYINIEILFAWIKSRPQMKIYWTMHDCWAFTGHCDHFTAVKCDKWRTHCKKCPKKGSYPKSYIFDSSYKNFDRKKKSFLGVKDLTIICPSKWLSAMLNKSFMKPYRTIIKNNVIDKKVFYPRCSSFASKYELENKKIVLGVASAWGKSKGLFDFYKIAELLDNNYKVVLVGLNKQQIKKIPKSILAIQRTDSSEKLAEIYSVAYVFVNPTYEDTFPTVNLEAQACGTPVITYNTGGSPELVPKENVVEMGRYDLVVELIENNKFVRKI